jgi:hypothetical protein
MKKVNQFMENLYIIDIAQNVLQLLAMIKFGDYLTII